jgi:hypothetical protein
LSIGLLEHDRQFVNAAVKPKGEEEGGEKKREICTAVKWLSEVSDDNKLPQRKNNVQKKSQ